MLLIRQKLVFSFPHNQDRTRSEAHNIFRDTAEENVLQSGSTVCGYDDHVRRQPSRSLDNFAARNNSLHGKT
jgi:hypothetical protein